MPTTPQPWESAPAAHQDGAKPWEAAPSDHQADAASGGVTLPDGMKAFKLPNGSLTVQRPSDGAVYIKASNDPQFQDQEGWKYQDHKTGVWVPAPAVDPAKMSWLQKNLGGDAWKAVGRNVVAGVQAPVEAMQGLGHDVANAVGAEGDKSYVQNISTLDQRQKYRQALANTGGTWAKADQLMGETIPATAVMATTNGVGGATMAATEATPEMATPYISRLAATGLKAMPYAYATTPGDQDYRLKAGMITGVAAPLVQAGLDKVVVPASKLAWQGIKSLLGGAPSVSPEVAQLTTQAADHNVPLTTGETLPTDSKVGRLARGLEDSGEPTARWFSNTNEGQDKAGQAAQGLLKQVQQKGQAMGFESEDAFRQALAADPYNKQLNALKQVVDQAKSGDPVDVAEASANLKNWASRQDVSKVYDQARAAAENIPKPLSSLKNTGQAMDKVTGEINQLPESARGAYSDIQNLQQDFQGALKKGGDTTVRKYNSLDATSNWLGDQASETTDPTKARFYRILQQGVEDDKRALATANPGTKFQQLFNEADKRFATEVAPFQDNAVAKAMRSSTPDEVQAQFMKRGGYTDRGLKFFDALDPKGQNAVKEKFLQDAIDAATDRTQPGQPFDPHKFVGYLDNYRGARKVIMSGADEDALNGLENIMQHLKARPNSNVKPSFFSSLSAGGATVINTGPMKSLLLAADNLKPGSNAMGQLLTKSAALQGGKTAADTAQE